MEEKKVIWITGASSGIGRALAIKFANEGWIVAASARRENLLQELNKINENIYAFPLDVTNISQCKSVFKSIIEKHKSVEISVFGTGIHDPKSEKKFNLDKIREIMEVNYFGTMNSINSVYDYFNNKKSGQISIISSVAGYRGLPAAGAYCASKSALTSFAESLHFEMKRKNVRVSLVSPGFIKTPMTDQNDFPMPMIKSPEFAAEQIYKGLIKKKIFEIHFPKAFTYFLKFLRILPSSIYFKFVEKGMKKIDY
ncbi:MAG: SDR family NAD(P)-dependent oxidoreductase [Candidatus Pelagibacterales bacterium]|nr:short-chain dehydrogenase [Candidatus Pelagibacter sp.]RZO62819.1 MAG: SDR family NAD(P)-dependent oxidoreductase [Pelagibacterales bacterium]|tara:strand:+ start:306 stop:1067 length:762 start_codon:yes stop_codon:yes gene_type:complete